MEGWAFWGGGRPNLRHWFLFLMVSKIGPKVCCLTRTHTHVYAHTQVSYSYFRHMSTAMVQADLWDAGACLRALLLLLVFDPPH